MATQKQGLSKKAKIAIGISGTIVGTYILANATYRKARNIVFGKDENPWRKALFYTAVAGTIIAYKYGDEIKESYHNFMDRAKEIVQQRDIGERDKLRNRLEEQYIVTSSLEEAKELMLEGKKKLRKENAELANNNRQLEEKILEQEIQIREQRIREEERSKYISQNNSQQPPMQQTSIATNTRIEREKRESPGLIERLTSPFRRDNATETQVMNRDDWYIVRPGETLSGIAQKYYGDISLFNELARHNNIRNPSDVAVGTPLRMLPGRALKTNENILTSDMPRYITVNRGESLADVVVREGLARPRDARTKAQEILEFNINELGYRPINMRESRIRESIVYTP